MDFDSYREDHCNLVDNVSDNVEDQKREID